METRKVPFSMRHAVALAYRVPDVQPLRRTKRSGIPGRLFDFTIVCLFVLMAVHYLFTAR
jgi:hypothetical protein